MSGDAPKVTLELLIDNLSNENARTQGKNTRKRKLFLNFEVEGKKDEERR